MCDLSHTGSLTVPVMTDLPAAELASMRHEFPQFRIWREVLGDREPRFVACRRYPGINPYTVITTEPAELRAALAASPAHPAPGGPPRFDPHVPHPARVYNVWLHGKDHYEADRKAAEEVLRHRPQAVTGARANRSFLARAVRYLAAERGIRQFLDLGTGLPAPGNTHEVAQAIAPESRIVFVDNDPLVLAHVRALLTSTPQGSCDYVDADLRETSAILGEASHTLDLTRPVAVLLLAVLHFVPNTDDAAAIVATLTADLAPGSCVAISHLTADFAPEPVASGVAAYNTLVPTPLTPRTHAQVTALFGGLPLAPPGVVPITEWRPDSGFITQPHDLYAGLATVPGRRR